MQEDMTQKTIALVFMATSFTARHFEAVLREAKHDLERHDTAVQNKKNIAKQAKLQRKPKKSAPVKKERHRKMRIGELVGQGEKLATIQIPEDLKSFQRIARKYNVDFAVKKDRSEEPPKYIIFFKAKDTDMLKECFRDYLVNQKLKHDRPTFKERLTIMKQKVQERAQQRQRAREKILNRGDQSL